MGFVKLDCAIVDSSLWVEREHRSLFITALVMAEPYELAEATAQLDVDTLTVTGYTVPAGWYGMIAAAGSGIIRRDGMSQPEGLAALRALCAPDPHSRSQDFEGRRLARVDGGYLVLNYFKYRDKDFTAAERMRRLRARKKAAGTPVELPTEPPTVTRNTVDVTANVTQAEYRAQRTEDREHTTRTTGLAASPPGWLSHVCDVYERHYGAGSFNYGMAGRTLKPLHVAGHSGEEIAARMDRYCNRLDDIKYFSLPKFRATFGAFADDAVLSSKRNPGAQMVANIMGPLGKAP